MLARLCLAELPAVKRMIVGVPWLVNACCAPAVKMLKPGNLWGVTACTHKNADLVVPGCACCSQEINAWKRLSCPGVAVPPALTRTLTWWCLAVLVAVKRIKGEGPGSTLPAGSL